MSVAIALLAAGGARRFGTRKLLAELDGKPLVRHALDAATTSGLQPVLLVTNDPDVGALAPENVQIVANPEWESGLASSVTAALRHAGGDPAVDAICIGLGDQPRVGPESYRRLAAAHLAAPESIVVATYAGERRNPVLAPRALWPDLMGLSGDAGIRALFGVLPVIEVACDGTGDPRDVDTPEDLDALQGRTRAT